jgi:hypothetical protein
MIWKMVFDVVKWKGRKWTHTEKFWNFFLLLKYWVPPFQKRETFGHFLPFSFFFYASFPLFSMLRSFIEEEPGDFWNIWGGNNFFLSFKWDGSGYRKIYEIGGLAENLSAVDAFHGMDLCTPIIFIFCLGEASTKISQSKNHFEKFNSSRRTRPLTNANENMTCYVEYIWLW